MPARDTGAAIIGVARQLDAEGFNSGTSGNISIRTREGMLITPTGIPSSKLTVNKLVRMTLGGKWSGAVTPSSEWAMHARIYSSFPAAGAVIHAHPDNCVALSCLRADLPAFHYMVAAFGGTSVRCADYQTFGTAELADSVVSALADRNACLLANHGMICYGADLASALARAVKLETLARQYMLARAAGLPISLNDAQMQVVQRRYRTYGQQPDALPQTEGRASSR
jgi:L-fuculose-phosphate aldolase